MMNQISIDETQRRINKLMDISDATFVRYGPKDPETGQVSEDEAVLEVAKMMGVDPEDIQKYGYKEQQ